MKAILAIALTTFLAATSHATILLSYQFEEGSGTTVANSVAPANDGTLTNGAAFSAPNISLHTPGSFSLSLDGTNDFVAISNPNLLQNVGGFTLSAFIRLSSLPTTGNFENIIFISRQTDGNLARANLQISDLGALTVGGRRLDGDGFSRYATTTGLITTGTTYHVAATVDFNASGNAIKLFINGGLVANTLFTGPGFSLGDFTSNTASAAAVIGRQGSANAEYLHGLVDDLRVYNTALSDSAIAALAIPEPSTVLSLIFGLAALVLTRRHRA